MPAADQDFCGTLAALSASHHQIVGNAELPYFGMVSGRLKRFQRAVRSKAISPLRHDVEIPQQHAVERPGGGDQLVAVLGENDAIDERIDRRVLDADQVARAGNIGGLRAPVAALLVARRQRLAPGGDDDVEVPLPHPVLVLRTIDGAHGDGHAEALERGLVEQHDALESRLLHQKLDGETLVGLGVDQLGVAHLVAGVVQQAQPFAQVVAHRLLAAAGRVGVGLREQLGRHLVLHRLQDVQLLALRAARTRQARCPRNSWRCACTGRRRSPCSSRRSRRRN